MHSCKMDKETIRRKERERYVKNRDRLKAKSLAYYYANKEKVLDYQTKRWSRKYQEDPAFRKKRQLRDASRPHNENLDGEVCNDCGSTLDLQRHHPTYTSIKVIILCRGCHNKIHEAWKQEKARSIQATI